MKERMQGLIIGTIVGALCAGGAVFAKTMTANIEVNYDNIKIYKDGELCELKDSDGNTVEPFIYDGTTYMPVRGTANLAGMDVTWDGDTKSVYLWDEYEPYESGDTTDDSDDSYTDTDEDTAENAADEVVRLVNEQRAANGLAALTSDGELGAAAAIRAQELPELFSHTRPDGTSCFTVLDGVSYSTCGENIAEGQTSAESVMNSWMNSQGHRENILNSAYTRIGVGVRVQDGRYYWVQLFAG